ncbi:MAG: hypothetical protein ABR585_09660 [Gemmatimonadaceae bacterium]
MRSLAGAQPSLLLREDAACADTLQPSPRTSQNARPPQAANVAPVVGFTSGRDGPTTSRRAGAADAKWDETDGRTVVTVWPAWEGGGCVLLADVLA